ncbi:MULTISPECIES: ferritin-like domain-containing protein [unclassified Cryobacterium]|uniref:ferritin-like domain-containing protein n=1 Tax=unclassified Cryobacterium TaxID=2649013 RepID=UPI00106D1794|nr:MULTISPECIES: ferritin-like domain-containing protein [unclassified Cryobacterium]TFD04656.1 ferritin-like domain-containing protein [Cryobacterium sp. TMT1-66-1]TFD08396.1 ferritin-like domain-containing protein [Cryobacterium sp. TMT1-2-2]
MFDQGFITSAINRSAENSSDRRNFLRAAGVAGFGVGAAMLATGSPALAAESTGPAAAPSDASILNFALNLEYLEAEFYLRATTGSGLPDSMTTGTGTRGGVTGGRMVHFKTSIIKKYAAEIAADEKAHVAFLRSALGSVAVSRPKINLDASFTAAAQAAGLVKPGQKFDVYANEANFLFGAFIFEDVGVTAYKGAAPLISNKTYLEAAAGLLAVEAYHAGVIRSTLYALGVALPSVYTTVQAISDVRDAVDGPTDLDQGIGNASKSNLVPTDANGLAFSRSAAQVLNITYLNAAPVRSGGFFPAGVNGVINTSGANG